MRVWRREASGRWRSVDDAVAREEPLEIRVNGRAIAVVMRTPGHDDALVAGFLLTEGVIRDRAQLTAIRPYPRNRDGNVIDVVLADGVVVDLARLTRHVFGASSCGLCGKTSIAAVRQQFPRVRDRFRVTPGTVLAVAETLRAGQRTFARTGGVHAAGLFSAGGDLRSIREDVGRHNAVDKVLGREFLDGGTPCRESLLVVSGRASFEIVQKALAAGVAIIAAVGAPSGLAVEFARAAGQTLIGFVRDGRFNVYTGRGRIGEPVRGR